MHHHNIVHRDIKPENILYRSEADDANIVLVDFGIATHLRHQNDTDLHDMCGSIGYAAPEVVAKKYYGKQVDMWGLGVVTFCMLCGFAPFSSADPALFRRQIESAEVKFDQKYWATVSDTGIDFVKRCLTRDPDERITSDEALQHPVRMSHSPSGLPVSKTCSKTMHKISARVSERTTAPSEKRPSPRCVRCSGSRWSARSPRRMPSTWRMTSPPRPCSLTTKMRHS